MPPRSLDQRTTDVLAALGRERDAWVASAGDDGVAYLIPLSFLWDGERLVFATPARSRTVRDLRRAGRTRVALPSTDEVVILDGDIGIAALDADPALVAAFAARAGFDPSRESDPYVLLLLTPTRIQTWRDAAELTGRDVMREGRWLDPSLVER